MTEDDIREMVRLMSRGGCENRVVATAVAQATRTATESALKSPQQAREDQQRLFDKIRAEGWFE